VGEEEKSLNLQNFKRAGKVHANRGLGEGKKTKVRRGEDLGNAL